MALITAGVALAGGSLIGAYDLISGLEHINHVLAHPAAAGS